MGRRALPVLLVSLAALADSRGSHALAFYSVFVAVPCSAVAALASFARYLEAREDATAALHALLWAFVVGLLVLSCMVRSTALHAVPPIAFTAVVACLVIFAVKLTVAVAPYAQRLLQLRPAKP